MSNQRLHHAIGGNSAVPQQAKSPQRPNLARVVRGIRFQQQMLYCRIALAQSISGQLHFNSGSSHILIVGIKSDGGELAELRIPAELSAPAFHMRLDLGVRSARAADRASQQYLSLFLR